MYRKSIARLALVLIVDASRQDDKMLHSLHCSLCHSECTEPSITLKMPHWVFTMMLHCSVTWQSLLRWSEISDQFLNNARIFIVSVVEEFLIPGNGVRPAHILTAPLWCQYQSLSPCCRFLTTESAPGFISSHEKIVCIEKCGNDYEKVGRLPYSTDSYFHHFDICICQFHVSFMTNIKSANKKKHSREIC